MMDKVKQKIELKDLLRTTQLKGALAIVALSCVFFMAVGLWTASRFATNNLDLLGRTIAYSLEAPLVFHDAAAVNEVLEAFAKKEGLAWAKVYDATSNILGEYAESPPMGWAGDWLSGMLVDQPINHPIQYRDKYLGYLQLAVRPSLLMQFFVAGATFSLFAFLLCIWMSRIVSKAVQARIQAPLDILSTATREIARKHRFSNRIPNSDISELDQLSVDINELVKEVQHWQKIVEDEKSQLARSALQDSLTAIGNRRCFDEVIDNLLLKNKCQSFALLILDCDRFKHVNDQYGHASGDLVLKHIAKRVSELLRHGDQVFRIGGDEFAILLLDVQDYEAVNRAVMRFKSHIDGEFKLLGNTAINISVSLGAGLFPHDGNIKDLLIKHADMNMYRSKHLVYKPKMQKKGN